METAPFGDVIKHIFMKHNGFTFIQNNKIFLSLKDIYQADPEVFGCQI